MKEILPGVFHWTAIHPKIHVEVSSYWLQEGGVLIDPVLPPDVGLDWFGQRSAVPAAIVLSNRHHYRDSARFARRFGCSVHCNGAGLHEFTHGEQVEAFDPGDRLPGGILAYEIGGICPDDTALYLPVQRALAFADGLVRGGPHGQQGAGDGGTESGAPDEAGGALGFVPDALMDDPPETKRLLLASFDRALAELEFEHILLAHGRPLVGNGRAALEELVRSGGRTAFEL